MSAYVIMIVLFCERCRQWCMWTWCTSLLLWAASVLRTLECFTLSRSLLLQQTASYVQMVAHVQLIIPAVCWSFWLMAVVRTPWWVLPDS